MSNQALTTEDAEGRQHALIDMIDNLGRIIHTQFDAAKGRVRTLQNDNDGSGASAVRKQWFDDGGRLAWSMDELGRVTSRQYNPLTGRLARTNGFPASGVCGGCKHLKSRGMHPTGGWIRLLA